LAAKQEEMAATWQAQRDEMENTWIHNRADMERQYKNSFHVIEQDITNAKQTLEDIRSQNEALQQKVNAKTQQHGQLGTVITDATKLQKEMQHDTTELHRTMHLAKQVHHEIEINI
jgi:chromosome segregation ATPase